MSKSVDRKQARQLFIQAQSEDPVPALPSYVGAVSTAVFAIALGLYLRTLHPTVAGGDSGELMSAAHTLGVAHPPGYPTFTLYTKLGEVLIRSVAPHLTVGYAQNVASALLSSLAVALLYVTGVCITGTHEAGLLAAFFFGYAPNVWTYACHTEVFPMNNFFVTLLLAMVSVYNRLLLQGLQRTTLLTVSAFVCGLALTNQHTSILFVVPVVLWVLVADWKLIFLEKHVLRNVFISAVAGLSPYLYMPLSAKFFIFADSWGDCGTINGFFTHLFRIEYGTMSLASKEAPYRISNFAKAWSAFFVDLCDQTLGVGWVLSVVGAVVVFTAGRYSKRYISLERLLVMTWILYTNFFNYLSNLPIDQPLFLGIQQRFWIQPLTISSLFLGIGFIHCVGRVLKLPAVLSLLMVVLACTVQVWFHFEARDESRNYTVRDYGVGLIGKMPPHSIFLTSGDIVLNAARFVQVTERLRQDVRITDQEMLTYKWYNDKVKVTYPDVTFPGIRYFPGKPGCYSIKQFLDINGKAKIPGTNITRRIFIRDTWKEGDNTYNGHYITRPWGFVAEILPATSTVSAKAIDKYIDEIRQMMPLPPDFHLPPKGKVLPATSWEIVVEREYWTAWHQYGHYLVSWIQLNQESADKNPKVLEKCLLDALRAFGLVAAGYPQVRSQCYRNLGVIYQILYKLNPNSENLEAVLEYLSLYLKTAREDGTATEEELKNYELALGHFLNIKSTGSELLSSGPSTAVKHVTDSDEEDYS